MTPMESAPWGQFVRELAADLDEARTRRRLKRASCSVAIMAHPARVADVAALRGQLDRPARIVWDRFGDRHDTGRRAMAAYDPTATHHLVVQDDAVVARDLLAGVERALDHVPADAVLCLYVGRVRPYAGVIREVVEEAGNDASWIVMDECNWGVGIVMPTALIDECLAWYDDDGAKITNYDLRISEWCRATGRDVFYPWPSLVDHQDRPSLCGHGDGRHAYRFLGTDRSALEVDWTGRTVEIRDLGSWRARGGNVVRAGIGGSYRWTPGDG